MPRPWKVFTTHIGFYDMIVAAPSQKAAAEAFEAKPSIFTRGLARQIQDATAVQAALAQPGMVLKRPHGQGGAYKAQPDAIAVPKLTPQEKRVAAKSQADQRQKEAADRRAQQAAARKARKDAQDELANIEQEEEQLRARRQTLRKKFHLRSVK